MRELIANNYPKSSITEALRTVKTNLYFSAINNKIKKILVTSSLPGEGKSFVSANLATIFADPTQKVLLIDCDLRKGRQNKLFNLEEYSMGLSNLLIDDSWKKKLHKYILSTDIENLDVIISGSVPPNPTYLLESKRLEEIVNELEKEYDIIIFDTPPVTGLSDALILTRLVDTTLVVARARKTPVDMLDNTIKSLNAVNASIAGVILNRVKKSKSKYYNNYYTNK